MESSVTIHPQVSVAAEVARQRLPLPFIVTPEQDGQRLIDARARSKQVVEERLLDTGGVLFRGFRLDDVGQFRDFASSLGGPLLGYEFGSTPRHRVSAGVYTSTEYPSHQSIPLHNEQSYSRQWPMKIWFYCVTPSAHGGQTPIADSREIYRRVPPAIRRRLSDRGLMYVRNFGNGLDVPWAQVFETEDRAEVERYCRAHGIECEWKADGELRTRQVCQAVARHPVTHEHVWFNQAHLFHVSSVEADVREALLEAVGEEELPRNVYYGDGAPIEVAILDEIRGVLDEVQVTFPWEKGDVLMLDNMLTAHGRAPFSGDRKVVVAMAEAYSETRRESLVAMS